MAPTSSGKAAPRPAEARGRAPRWVHWLWLLAAGAGVAGLVLVFSQARVHRQALRARAAELRAGSWDLAGLGATAKLPSVTPIGPGSPSPSSTTGYGGTGAGAAPGPGGAPAPGGGPPPPLGSESAPAPPPPPPLPEVLLAATEAGTDAVLRRYGGAARSASSLQSDLGSANGLVEAARIAPASYPVELRLRIAYGAAAVSDAAAQMPGSGYMADMVLRVRRHALCLARGALVDGGVDRAALRAVDELLLADGRRSAQLSAGPPAGSTDPLLEEIAASGDPQLSALARYELGAITERRQRALIVPDPLVSESLRAIVLGTGLADPRGALDAPPDLAYAASAWFAVARVQGLGGAAPQGAIGGASGAPVPMSGAGPAPEGRSGKAGARSMPSPTPGPMGP